MSSHHQTAGNPDKSDRRVEHHRERQATRTALQVPDLEEVLDPPSVHNSETLVSPGAVEETHHDSKHGKHPFWERPTKAHHGMD